MFLVAYGLNVLEHLCPRLPFMLQRVGCLLSVLMIPRLYPVYVSFNRPHVRRDVLVDFALSFCEHLFDPWCAA